ncbi:MAG: hypothetical protein E3K36_16575 [Candidatus Brocadia sp.]|nr:hypothetical protein [Candidatus Brocadia sp.]
MIEDHEPNDWKILQEGVCRIFNEIGLKAEINKEITTPRGKVSLDVFAIDPGSVDKIQYVVECKNWNSSIPQSVIHLFTTVIHEVGAHVGYIVSKHGFQKGSLEYLRNTNINALTFKDFQNHYMEIWIDRYFCKKVSDESNSLIQYTEPINSRRERYKANLSDAQLKEFSDLYEKYYLFGMILVPISVRSSMPQFTPRPDISVKNLNRVIEETLGPEAIIVTPFLRDYLEALIKLIPKFCK